MKGYEGQLVVMCKVDKNEVKASSSCNIRELKMTLGSVFVNRSPMLRAR